MYECFGVTFMNYKGKRRCKMIVEIRRNHYYHFYHHHAPWNQEKCSYKVVVAYIVEARMHALLRRCIPLLSRGTPTCSTSS